MARVKPLYLTVSLLILGTFFHLCHAQENSPFLDIPIYLNAKKLPAHFRGQDPEFIWLTIANRLYSRDEFETRAAYNKRIYAAKTRPILGKLNLDNYFCCMIDQSNDSMNNGPVVSYNIDEQRMSILIWPEGVSPHGSRERKLRLKKRSTYGEGYVGSNVYGATRDVIQTTKDSWELLFSNHPDFRMGLSDNDVFASYKFSAYVPAWKARSLKPNLRVLAVYKLVSPYIYQNNEHQGATTDYAVDGTYHDHYLNARIEEFWLYNFATGEIIRKVKRQPIKK